jgi:serine/threonine protein kinase
MSEPLRTLGRYTLKRRLAAGGMGEVYLGEVQGAANFTKQVAIKRILPHLAANEAFVAKFIDEANLMVQLHHGNIVPVLELADEGGELFIVMEYLPGRDLKAVLQRLKSQRKAFPVDLALWVAAEICDALDYAHRRTGMDGHPLHIVHRDVSPSNVMMGAAGEVKLLDFGIARARGGLHQSISGTLQGKFSYMSPEQAEGMHLDARSDVFSTGLVLYEMLTGQRPLEGESETETLRRVRQARVPPPSTHRPDLPPEVDALVLRALAASPDARYATAGAMRRDIAPILTALHGAADAAALHRFLAETFPEGVIPPSTEPGPLSMDDALKLQLGSLTPSVESLGNTRTATGPSGAQPIRPPQTFSTGDAGSPPGSRPPRPISVSPVSVEAQSGFPSGSQPVITQPPWPAPAPIVSRRGLAVLIALVALVAGGLWWMQRPVEASVRVDTQPATAVGLELTLDGHPFDGLAQANAGDRVDVCAQARDFKQTCKNQYLLRPGENVVALKLAPAMALIHFEAEPSQTTVVIEGLPSFRQGQRQSIELGEAVKVAWQADGYQTLEQTYNLFTLTDRTLRARLEPLPGAAPATSPSSPPTGPPSGTATAPPSRGNEVGVAARPRLIELQSTPAGAQVLEGGRAVGQTPLSLPAPRGRTTLTFRLAGYADAARDLDATTASPLQVTLTANPSGYLSVRVEPARGTLLLDGRDLGTNVLRNRPVPAGQHTLQAKFLDRESPLQTIGIEPGQTLQLNSIDLTRPEDQATDGPAAPGESP